MTTYIIGAISGLVFGVIVGALKNRFIWKSYLKRDVGKADDGEATAVYSRMIISNITNVITLVIAFLIRNTVPFDGIAFIIGTAVALTIMNKFLYKEQKNEQ